MSLPRSTSLYTLLAALALPVVYLLAMGPIWALGWTHANWYRPVSLLYQPVVRIAERHPQFDSWISGYVEQWYPKGLSHRGSIIVNYLDMGPAS